MATYAVGIVEFTAVTADAVLQWGAGAAVTANVSLTAIIGGPVWSLSVSESARANNTTSSTKIAVAAGTANVSATASPIAISDIIESSISASTSARANVVFSATIAESVSITANFVRVLPVTITESISLTLSDEVYFEKHVVSGAEEVYRKISPKIEMQFPGFIREEGPQFVAFLKGYYQFAEQTGMPIDAIRGLQDNQDVDRSLDTFVEYFRREFMPNIPKYVAADQRLMTKYIREFYRSRGSDDSFRAIFRAMFNKEIDLYYPGQDVLRASDGRWVKETIIRVGTPYNTIPTSMAGNIITGLTSGASARVENTQTIEASGILVYDLTIQGVVGTFSDGEIVQDEYGNRATINNQLGALTGISVSQGGAYHSAGGSYHEKGDVVEITGASSSEPAYGVVTDVSNRSAVEVTLLDGGSGYTKDHTVVTIAGGNGVGLSVRINSWTQTAVSTALNNDVIGPMASVMIGTPSYFVSTGANNSTVSSKLSGKLVFNSTSNTVYGIATSFQSQISNNLIVRIAGQANTLRVHTVLSDTSFISAFRPASNQASPGADAYIRLAAANVYSTLASAFAFSTTGTYSVNSIAILNPGFDYKVLPTITITDDTTSILNIDDGRGGFLGRNAVIGIDNAPGAIVSIDITAGGANFNRNELATIQNVTQGNSVIIESTPGNRGTTWRKSKTTFNAAGTPLVSGITNLPGRYTDTKGFLSWNNKLQDNYYYQEFSYVVRVTELVDKYRDIIKNLVHPAGTKMFGTYNMRSAASLPFTLAQSSSNIQNVRDNEPVTALDSFTGTMVSNGTITSSVTPAEITAAFVSKEVDISNAANANAIPVAIATYPGAGTANVTATTTKSAIATYPAAGTANTSVTDTPVAIGTYPAARTEAATANNTQDAIATYPGAGTANIALNTTQAAEKFLLASGRYVTVQYANSVVSLYESVPTSVYDAIAISMFDDKPRLVRIAQGTPWFANNALRANTGSIQVGGNGTSVIVASVGSGSTTRYQVNTIFSNTFLSLRTNYLPITSNATFAYSVG